MPGMQGPGGTAPPMNPMQKQGPPQGPPQGQPMPQGPPQQMGPQGGQVAQDSAQWMQSRSDMTSGLANRLNAARQELQRAQMLGYDPLTMNQLQSQVSALEQAAQRQMMQQQQQFGREAVRGPGIGGANQYDDGWQAQQNNNNIQMQMLAQLFGLGGGNRGGSSNGPIG